MGLNLHTPQQGDEISAAWARQLCDELRAMRLNAMPPLYLSRTPSGTSLRIRFPPAALGYPEPNDIKALSDTKITLTNICWGRGPTAKFQDGDLELALTGSEQVVSLKVNNKTGVATLDSGYDQTLPAPNYGYTRRALYKLAWNDDHVSIAVDLRNMPDLVLHT